ncbi:Ldh family oxidoreductase [Ammoniphilus sp. CFH 90114]|uniref:Ldh family oxidoreductase n=1 Tax=Ammoniphilus sp. CFH 90114 TaxID=2493665 RepID=UPI00100F37EE|nr:Ldh family oxidoreductase [Ammoniphilus sp. CFH 90114]RXT07220.1 Ldh family oxidoreductase [Ammoniphilus sp. CFH 90114]
MTDRWMPEDLRQLSEQVLIKTGVSQKHAQITTDVMLEANLRGIDSHGISYLPVYINRIEKGVVNPNSTPEIIQDSGSSFVVDGRNGLGQVAGYFSMTEAISRAHERGVGLAAVRRSGHFGMSSYYAVKASEQHCIGIVMTNAPSSVAPFGGMEALFGTNPMAFVFPVEDGPPLTIDFATSAVARTKLRNLTAEEPIPKGWALNKEGYPAKTAGEGYEGVLLPAAGVKGYALAIVAEVFSAILSQASFTKDVGGLVDQFDRSQNVGHFLGAISIESFLPMYTYHSLMREFIASIKSVKPAPGFDEIYYPGELEEKTAMERRENGIPLANHTLEMLRELRERYNL